MTTRRTLVAVLTAVAVFWCGGSSGPGGGGGHAHAAGAAGVAPSGVPTTGAPVPTTGSATAKAEARARFDRGLGLFEKGDNAAALAEFRRAYELIPNPIVLYNMGLVYAAMNRPVDAADALDRFLAEAGEKAAAEPLRHARKVRDEQAARVARLLVVTDQPSVIEVDGVAAGRSPMSAPLRMTSGAHTVTALAPGYQPARREVTLAGQVTETVTLTLIPTETGTAHLTIAVPVPGAEVSINGKVVGTTPLAGNVAVAPGEARVELRRPGYLSVSRVLRLDAGSNARLELAMVEDPAAAPGVRGRLRLSLSDPGAAELSIDEAPRPFAPEGVTLPSGPHVVRIRRLGFKPYETVVQVAAASETVLVVALVPTAETRAQAEETASARGTVGWWLVGGGLALAAGSGVYAVATRKDVSNAQASLDQRLALEQTKIQDLCYLGLDREPGKYEIAGCAATKASLQDDLDAASLKRVLALSGVGVGLVATGVGTYLLATRRRAHAETLSSPALAFAIDRDIAWAVVAGRF